MDSCLEHLDLSLHAASDSDRRVWHFNVAFVGSCRVGKTKLLQRFVDSQFSDIYCKTTDTAFVSKSVSIGRHHVVFQCWDTPGTARASGCLDSRLTQLHALFIVFDASRDAVADIEHWHHLALTAAAAPGVSEGPLLVLVANKTDLGCHKGSLERARRLRDKAGGLLFTLSVLTDEENLEVDAMMLEVGKTLTERHSTRPATSSGSGMPPSSRQSQLAGDSERPPSLQALQPRGQSEMGDGKADSEAEKCIKTPGDEESGSWRSRWWTRTCCCPCW